MFTRFKIFSNEVRMACSGQIESHVSLVMGARNKMREAKDTSLPRSTRLHLLDEAGSLTREAMKAVGKLPNLRALHAEVTKQFLKV